MPFIVNGLKLNKPIYEGVVLNAIHVWLQNHWTGAANASTSTLSQDGAVVATQNFPNPNCVSTGTMPTQIFSGKVQWGWSDKAAFNTPASSEYNGMFVAWIINGLSPNTNYVARCEVGTSVSDGSKWRGQPFEVTDVNGKTLAVSGFDTTKRVKVLSFTTKADGSITLKFRGNSVSDTAFYGIGVYTASDWAALQARGITWFDGESYVRGVV